MLFLPVCNYIGSLEVSSPIFCSSTQKLMLFHHRSSPVEGHWKNTLFFQHCNIIFMVRIVWFIFMQLTIRSALKFTLCHIREPKQISLDIAMQCFPFDVCIFMLPVGCGSAFSSQLTSKYHRFGHGSEYRARGHNFSKFPKENSAFNVLEFCFSVLFFLVLPFVLILPL